MKNLGGFRVAVYKTGGWYDLAPIATDEEIVEWERVCSALDMHTALASGTYNWWGRWSH
jgi:hypothetical protein